MRLAIGACYAFWNALSTCLSRREARRGPSPKLAVLARATTLHRNGASARKSASKGITRSTGTSAQAFACFVVVMIHIGLFWLLALKPRHEATTTADHSRLRLIFLPRPPPPAPALPPPAATPPTRSTAARMPTSASPPVSPSTLMPAVETGSAPAIDLASQAAAWAAQSADGDFAADPLRSRRAQLPVASNPAASRCGRRRARSVRCA
jgi:hypothetical protein